MACTEEEVYIAELDLNTKYSLSNSLDEIEEAVFLRAGHKVDLKCASWVTNSELAQCIRDLMDRHCVEFSMTHYFRGGFWRLAVNYKKGDEWFYAAFIVVNDSLYDIFSKEYETCAVDILTEYIELYPANSSAYFERGMMRDEIGLALDDFTEAIKLDPGAEDALRLRGIIHSVEGRYDLSIADSTRVIELNQKNELAYGNRGVAYSQQGKSDLAIADFTKSIELHRPRSGSYYYLRGNEYLNNGQNDLAVADFTEAIRLKPESVYSYIGRGHAYSQKGQYDLAITDFSEAIRLKPGDVEAYCYRGVAYSELEKRELAENDWKKVLEIDPNNVLAKEKLSGGGKAQCAHLNI